MGTDYTACEGLECPIKEQCHRFTGPREPLYQSYFVEIPGKFIEIANDEFNSGLIATKEWKCDMFWSHELQETIKSIFR